MIEGVGLVEKYALGNLRAIEDGGDGGAGREKMRGEVLRDGAWRGANEEIDEVMGDLAGNDRSNIWMVRAGRVGDGLSV